MSTEGKGIVIPLSETISIAEAEKAAKRVKEEATKQQGYVKELQGYRDETKALSKLVKGLPDSVSYNIMVPFGKAAFFPGRLIHTNEFLVLLGEGYYSERSAKQTVDILQRRNEFVQSKIANVEAHISDLEAEASFASNTAAEAKAGVVEIREKILEGTDKSFDLSSKSIITKAGALDQSRIKLQGESDYATSLGHSSMDEDEEHNRIMARIEALEAAEEAAGPTSDEEEVSDEEEETNSEDDHIDDAEAITKSKSYLSKDQKATLLEKLNRSEAEDYDNGDSDEEYSDSGMEDENEAEEDDEEEDRNNRTLSSNSGTNSERGGQSKSVGEVQIEGSMKPPRPLSRFGREVQSVKERAGIALEQRSVAPHSREILGKMVPSMDEKGASCSGLEILDMQGHNQSPKDWRTEDSTKRGFVLGHEAEKNTTVNSNDQKKGQKMGEPTPARMQAFTGTVTEHISRPAFPSRTGTVAERSPKLTSQSDVGKATDRIAKPSSDSDRQGEEQPSRPVSKFRQMRQAGGGK